MVVLLLLNFILGCKENSQSIKSEKIPQNKSEHFDLNFSGVSLKVEIAALPEERELGLMFRNSLKENEGMLFVFKEGTGQRFLDEKYKDSFGYWISINFRRFTGSTFSKTI